MERAINSVQKRGFTTSFGVTIKERTFAAQNTRYQFNGKEYDSETETSDFGARNLDGDLGVWGALDPMIRKYPSLSPYNFVGNMPIIAIDPDGKDIIVLSDPKGAKTAGHQAVLIGSEKSGFYYVSKDAFEGSNGVIESKSKFSVVKFKTIEEFKSSVHNYVLEEGSSYSDKNPVFKLDKDGNKIQRYEDAYRIETDPETDRPAAKAAITEAMKNYKLCKSDCSDVVTKALEVGKTKDGEDLKTGDDGIEFDVPINKQTNIRKNNTGKNVDVTPNP